MYVYVYAYVYAKIQHCFLCFIFVMSLHLIRCNVSLAFYSTRTLLFHESFLILGIRLSNVFSREFFQLLELINPE